jgi:hypothetical protein
MDFKLATALVFLEILSWFNIKLINEEIDKTEFKGEPLLVTCGSLDP